MAREARAENLFIIQPAPAEMREAIAAAAQLLNLLIQDPNFSGILDRQNLVAISVFVNQYRFT